MKTLSLIGYSRRMKGNLQSSFGLSESNAGGSLTTRRAPMPVRSKVRLQTKRDTLVLQDGGGGWARG
jgi:hypothetical protein